MSDDSCPSYLFSKCVKSSKHLEDIFITGLKMGSRREKLGANLYQIIFYFYFIGVCSHHFLIPFFPQTYFSDQQFFFGIFLHNFIVGLFICLQKKMVWGMHDFQEREKVHDCKKNIWAIIFLNF